MATFDVDRLFLIRHAMPHVQQDVPSDQWQLGDEGRRRARLLRPQLVVSAYFVASDEPKAVQTLQELADDLDVVTDRRFREVRRPSMWSDSYRSMARAYVEGDRREGWEDHAQVAQRFAAAVAHHASLASAAGRTLVVGTHGLAATVWLASVVRLDPDPAQFWERLEFPDLIDVDRKNGTAARCCAW
jgi:broad specificity phosphatase PhoE